MTLRFNSDGTFRVLQMADIQDGPNVREDTIRLIEAAIKKTHPDLIVFTGDQIRGYDPAYIDTFLRRRGENPGARVRLVTEIEAKLHGIHRRIAARRNPDLPPQDDVVTMDDLMNDTRTLHAAQAEAAALLAADPLLEAPEHSLLAAQVEQMFTKAGAMN